MLGQHLVSVTSNHGSQVGQSKTIRIGNTKHHSQCSWQLPHQTPSTFRRVCPSSHQNLVGERPTWKLTLISVAAGSPPFIVPELCMLGYWTILFLGPPVGRRQGGPLICPPLNPLYGTFHRDHLCPSLILQYKISTNNIHTKEEPPTIVA